MTVETWGAFMASTTSASPATVCHGGSFVVSEMRGEEEAAPEVKFWKTFVEVFNSLPIAAVVGYLCEEWKPAE
ncbi:unnamed protein product, partial [Durusdinium trenchii]